MLATGEKERKISRHTILKLHVFDQIVLKNLEISKQKGTVDVNLVFTAILACSLYDTQSPLQTNMLATSSNKKHEKF